jgi:excisionase family DNA binding protein
MIKEDAVYQITGKELLDVLAKQREAVTEATVKAMYKNLAESENENTQLITVQEAATMLRVHENSVYKMIRSGRLRPGKEYSRVERKILISKKALMERMNNQLRG